MNEWLPLENGVVKIIIDLEYQDKTKKSKEYKTQEGIRVYRDFMKDKNIYFGRLREIYTDGAEIRKASFCNGRA